MNRLELREAAANLLRKNDRGGSTIPSPRLYPHQWNWDSAFAAIGWSHIDPPRAVREIELLVRGQWADGLVPHILFHPEALHYEPGPGVWKTEGAEGRPAQVRTSSITQPPVAATALRRVVTRAGGDREIETRARALLGPLAKWHAWFGATRDPRGWGVPCIVHPWESGMDNAPRWDEAMRRLEPGVVDYKRRDNTVVDPENRPTRFDYDRYFYLVNERARRGFVPPLPEDEPFLVADVAMAAILARAEEDLAWLSLSLGEKELAEEAKGRRARLARGMTEELYDPANARFFDRDAVSGEPVRAEHVARFIPLFGGILPPGFMAESTRLLRDPSMYGAKWPIPSVPPSDPAFEPKRYWRGPSWINVNWLIVEGLLRAGEGSLAGDIAARSIELVANAGFREYFDPITGEGLGADEFSWTAAIVIDWIERSVDA